MKLTKIKEQIVCDTVMCNKLAKYKLSTNSYKGNIYLCENCFNALQKIFKGLQINNEEK